jgi:hypothetical protein
MMLQPVYVAIGIVGLIRRSIAKSNEAPELSL